MNTGKPIRVTIISPGPQSEGGIRSVVERIYGRLNDRDDIQATWLASQRVGSSLGKFLFFARSLIQSLYILPRSDVVHLHGAVHVSLLRKSAYIWLARIFGCRIIYHFHAPKTEFEKFFSAEGSSRRYARATLRQCDTLVVLSDSWEPSVRDIFPDSRIAVIYNPVMEARGTADVGHGDSLDVLYLAHLIRRKGFDDLIRAFRTVVGNVPQARLVFCGSGETEYARQLAAELGISANVIFRGWIPESGIAEQLAAATVFCLPSYDEGLPMGILEAMSSGVAIVTTPVGGIPDVLTHEENALLANPGDTDGLATQLTRLLADVNLRQRLADNALRDSAAFHPDKITREWANLYHSVTGQREAARQ
jgi:glycosyltransferase involved in cell wall biosynthesis